MMELGVKQIEIKALYTSNTASSECMEQLPFIKKCLQALEFSIKFY